MLPVTPLVPVPLDISPSLFPSPPHTPYVRLIWGAFSDWRVLVVCIFTNWIRDGLDHPYSCWVVSLNGLKDAICRGVSKLWARRALSQMGGQPMGCPGCSAFKPCGKASPRKAAELGFGEPPPVVPSCWAGCCQTSCYLWWPRHLLFWWVTSQLWKTCAGIGEHSTLADG